MQSEIKLELNWNFLSFWIAFILSEGATQTTSGKIHQWFFLVMDLPCHNTNIQRKWTQWCGSGINAIEVFTNL